jgi:diaminopimelate epimerase
MSRPRSIVFEKWEGLGNDFVILEAPSVTPALARTLCDRRRGIGADGILQVIDAAGPRPRMIVLNADGSRPQMCGNGLRCVAAYVGASVKDRREVTVLTDAGERRCIVSAGAEHEFEATVHMGSARLGGEMTVDIGGAAHRFEAVDVGNPHAVTFDDYAPDQIDRVGSAVDAAVPGGINVEFCRPHKEAHVGVSRIDVTVWERGVGRTLACGTGACAVAAVACKTGLAEFGAPTRIALPGGELQVVVHPGSMELTMTGPARRVYRGEVAVP